MDAKITESRVKIRFNDCDPFSHLNNSRYIDYIMDAREDQVWEHYRFDLYKLAREEQRGWVSAQTQVSYMFPAFAGEMVTIQTRLLAYTEKSLLLEGLMWDNDKTRLKALLWTKLVHFDLKTQQSLRHSDTLLDFFRGLAYPLDQAVSFEERVHTFRQQPKLNNHEPKLP
ncbi:acyl-CoA thioesterase [Niabella beijingensis]|uniref:acyl-CoA thioesterase n=1 Tax=Niabella beijingensis TaxID=2872700 RepID=UPI001CC0C16B|nr:acyl-CoA thioesterase [Niabella beijingensis]MBZ4189463.1 acyl-CoA thioesterase [Niabella beijingensis]